MRVGILTFQQSNNYGALLQTYALQQTLQNLGVQADVLRFPPVSIRATVRRFLDLAIGHRFVPAMTAHIKYAMFRHKRFQYSAICRNDTNLKHVCNTYDAIVVGSDQVWNTNFGPHMKSYFLPFGDDLHSRRISYAPCFGRPDQPQFLYTFAPELLHRFNWLSARNEFSRVLVQELTGLDVPVVADPTMLYDYADFCNAIPYGLPNEYILIYALEPKDAHLGVKVVAASRRTMDIPVVTITSSAHMDWDFPDSDYVVKSASPEEWVSLFRGARFVFTDSFHGAVFSLKYRKDFLAYGDDGWRSHRLLDLLHRYGVQKRFVTNAKLDCVPDLLNTHIDHSDTHNYITKHIEYSMEYLHTALESKLVLPNEVIV